MTSVAEKPRAVPARRTEALPFRVRLARDAQDVERAVDIRASAYARHVPHIGALLRSAEAEDHRSDVLLLIAERKLDRRAIGTLRLEPNRSGPLRIERETKLPPHYHGRRLVETSRLGVTNGVDGKLVMASLVKAAFQICRLARVDYTISVGRRSMAEMFRAMCFDVLHGPVHLSYSATVPFWVFGASVDEWDARLAAGAPPYFDFMACTDHPDIAVDADAVAQAFATA